MAERARSAVRIDEGRPFDALGAPVRRLIHPKTVGSKLLGVSICLMEPGNEIRRHRHDYEEAYFVVRGRGRMYLEGEGEILSVRQTPQEGQRALALSPHGAIIDERWEKLPSSYVIRRWGRENNKKKIALTFDDGPDSEFTPQILDILNRERVRATFFMIGRNAEANAGLTRRVWDEGNEIGNHTFNHPNLSLASSPSHPSRIECVSSRSAPVS